MELKMASYLLIHGSWHGAWCWYKVATRLRRAGHRVITVELPAHGQDRSRPQGITLEDYVNAAELALAETTGSAIVVAHSRGGIVASQLAERRPDKVAALVYLAAFLLPDGARVVDYAISDHDSLVSANLLVDPDGGWDLLHRSAYREVLYADCSEEDIALCESLLVAEPLQPTWTALQLSARRYGRIPRYYIELTQDRAVSPSLQRKMYTRVPCTRIFSIDASHSAYFSKPDELSRYLLALE